MIEFKLPSLGADMTEGKLLAWHVQPGDSVKRGQVVAVVDTSKAAIDVEIWQDGVVQELLVPVGDKVPVTDRRPRHRRGSPGDAADRQQLDPRCTAVPVHASGAVSRLFDSRLCAPSRNETARLTRPALGVS